MTTLRWLLVLAVVLWLAYEYTKPYWADSLSLFYTTYGTHLKFVAGAVAIVALLSVPSVETLLQRYTSVQDIARQFLVDDRYTSDFRIPSVQQARNVDAALYTKTNARPPQPQPPQPAADNVFHRFFDHASLLSPVPPAQRASQPSPLQGLAREQFRSGVQLARGDVVVATASV